MLEQYGTLVGQARSAWRFRWTALIVGWSLAIVGWVGVFFVPSKFESTARIYVNDSLMKPVLDGLTVGESASSPVDMVRRAMLSRPQLERIINETDLSKRVKDDRDRETMLADLTKTITIQADATGSSSREPNVFQIAYSDADPALALKVVQGTLQSFVSQSVGETRSGADVTQKFLNDQIADYTQRLNTADAKLADFKRKNIGVMPDDKGGYFEKMQAAVSSQDQLQSDLAVATAKRDALRSKLMGGTTASATDNNLSVETSVDGKIRDSQAKLEELLLRFTDQHPDVIAMRETIARLELQRKDELAAMRSNSGALGTPRASTSLVAQNLQISLNQAETDVTSLESQLRERNRQVGELRARVNTVPEVEAQLAQLNRDYATVKGEYDKLVQRRESAQLSDAAGRVDEDRFRVLEAPVQALIPTKPRRAILLLAVLGIALAAGVGSAWGLAQIRPIFTHPGELRFEGIPVLGVIGEASDVQVAAAHKRDIAKVVFFTGGLVVAAAAMILLSPMLEVARRSLFS